MEYANSIFPLSSPHSGNDDACSSLALIPGRNSNPPSQVSADLLSSLYPSYPLFYPIPSPPPSALPISLVPNRRRAQHDESSTTVLQRKAEKNRIFARESRERKRLYVEGLEREVAGLRSELTQMKRKFADYELIDRKRDLQCKEHRTIVLEALDEAKRTNADPKQFARIMLRKLDEQFEERRKAMGQLFRMLLEVAVPMSLRFHMWEADHDVDVLNPDSITKYLGYGPYTKEMNEILTHIKFAHVDYQDTHRVLKSRIVKTSVHIRTSVRQILDAQKAIQLDTFRIMNFLKKHVESNYTAEQATDDLRFAPVLLGRTEFSDESIFKVTDKDLWADTSVPGEAD